MAPDGLSPETLIPDRAAPGAPPAMQWMPLLRDGTTHESNHQPKASFTSFSVVQNKAVLVDEMLIYVVP